MQRKTLPDREVSSPFPVSLPPQEAGVQGAAGPLAEREVSSLLLLFSQKALGRMYQDMIKF